MSPSVEPPVHLPGRRHLFAIGLRLAAARGNRTRVPHRFYHQAIRGGSRSAAGGPGPRAARRPAVDLGLPDYPGGQHITLAQLLNYTSGVKSCTGIRGYMGNPVRRDLNTGELVAEFSGPPTDFAPGQGWAYDISGYVLVGAAIEAITRQPWHAQVAAMLQPLGLQRTVYDDPDRVIPGLVAGHSRGSAGLERAGLVSMTQPHAASALDLPAHDHAQRSARREVGLRLRLRHPQGNPARPGDASARGRDSLTPNPDP